MSERASEQVSSKPSREEDYCVNCNPNHKPNPNPNLTVNPHPPPGEQLEETLLCFCRDPVVAQRVYRADPPNLWPALLTYFQDSVVVPQHVSRAPHIPGLSAISLLCSALLSLCLTD